MCVCVGGGGGGYALDKMNKHMGLSTLELTVQRQRHIISRVSGEEDVTLDPANSIKPIFINFSVT